MIVMFQNGKRMRSGRLLQPTVADISVEWLMQAYLSSLQKEGKNLHIVPVAINYDRLFEIRNLAQEIVSADNGKLSVFDVRRMISEQSEKTVGKVYVTFGSTVSLKDFFKEKQLEPLNQANLDQAGLQLTTHLVLQQEYASPVVLNMIVASLLLQS